MVGVSWRGSRPSTGSFGSEEDQSQHLEAYWLEARSSDSTCKVCSQSPSKERPGTGHLPVPSVLSPGGQVWQVPIPAQKSFFVFDKNCSSPLGLGTQALLAGRDGLLGACPLGSSLKSWSATCVVQPLAPQGEAGSWEFLPDGVVLCWGWGFWQECVSAFPIGFDVGVFSVAQNVRVTQLVCGFFSERIALCVAVYLLWPWEEANSGASYVTIWVQSLILTLNDSLLRLRGMKWLEVQLELGSRLCFYPFKCTASQARGHRAGRVAAPLGFLLSCATLGRKMVLPVASPAAQALQKGRLTHRQLRVLGLC